MVGFGVETAVVDLIGEVLYPHLAADLLEHLLHGFVQFERGWFVVGDRYVELPERRLRAGDQRTQLEPPLVEFLELAFSVV